MNAIDEGDSQNNILFAFLWIPGLLGPLALFFYLI